MSNFNLDETNVVNQGIEVYKKLPEGIEQFPHSAPPQAVGSGGRRFTWCANCGGWIPFGPVIQNRGQNAMPFTAGPQASSIYRCRRCGQPIDTNTTPGAEKKNASGIGTEGTLRP